MGFFRAQEIISITAAGKMVVLSRSGLAGYGR
jgi:hypothetical protein